jgi:hypothetical protein
VNLTAERAASEAIRSHPETALDQLGKLPSDHSAPVKIPARYGGQSKPFNKISGESG